MGEPFLKSLHRIIEPCPLMLAPDDFDTVSVRIMPGDVRSQRDMIERKEFHLSKPLDSYGSRHPNLIV